jgi:hypothetical protein
VEETVKGLQKHPQFWRDLTAKSKFQKAWHELVKVVDKRFHRFTRILGFFPLGKRFGHDQKLRYREFFPKSRKSGISGFTINFLGF